ncbi:hypothetical protein [Phytopseudomonas dryadis]|nr:hypothetical protein [Pseudomonas dryadis]
MDYREPQYLDRQSAENAFTSKDAKVICDALISVALYNSDWKWVQDKCLEFLDAENPEIRGLAATCFGHIARIHRRLDKEVVISALHEHLQDDAISGQVSDALDDIDMFLSDGE